ncbi:MAG: AraC family transcriptional regulator [Oscillospiraceae bacterium]|nr:AraC family transcriptional regulator [Oscillospiraceae bacterium]
MSFSEIVINEQLPGVNPVNFGYEVCKSGHSFGPAVREYWLLHYVVSGTGVFEREGQTHTVQAGEVFVIPPSLVTFYRASHSRPWHYIWIGFTADPTLTEPLNSPILRVPGMGEIFEEMRSCHELERGRSSFLAARIWDLLALLKEGTSRPLDYIDKALHCIHAEYMTDLNVTRLASRLNLERSYFSTLFKEKTGVSPAKFLADLRLSKAAELMTVHRKSPSTAAASVGYPDLYHFSKAFKQKYGISPREYQKRHS